MKHLARYIFVILILVLVYMVYLVLSYKYTEYRIMQYIDEITINNDAILDRIEETKLTLEYKDTKAYKNKILKSER
jgi:Ca2+/Na+ antiporter